MASSTIRSISECRSLLWVTNQNTVTQHVWTSRVPQRRSRLVGGRNSRRRRLPVRVLTCVTPVSCTIRHPGLD